MAYTANKQATQWDVCLNATLEALPL